MVDPTFISLKGLLHDVGLSLFLARPLAIPQEAVEFFQARLTDAGVETIV